VRDNAALVLCGLCLGGATAPTQACSNCW
jgi:hypothetical protein